MNVGAVIQKQTHDIQSPELARFHQSLVILGMNVGAVFQKQMHDIQSPPRPVRRHQGHVSLDSLGMNVGAVFQEKAHDSHESHSARCTQGHVSQSMNVGAVFEQKTREFHIVMVIFTARYNQG